MFNAQVKPDSSAIADSELKDVVAAARTWMFSEDPEEKHVALILCKMAFRIAELKQCIVNQPPPDEVGLKHISTFLAPSMTTQEAELLIDFRRQPQDSRDMIARLAKQSASNWHNEMDEAIASIDAAEKVTP